LRSVFDPFVQKTGALSDELADQLTLVRLTCVRQIPSNFLLLS